MMQAVPAVVSRIRSSERAVTTSRGEVTTQGAKHGLVCIHGAAVAHKRNAQSMAVACGFVIVITAVASG